MVVNMMKPGSYPHGGTPLQVDLHRMIILPETEHHWQKIESREGGRGKHVTPSRPPGRGRGAPASDTRTSQVAGI